MVSFRIPSSPNNNSATIIDQQFLGLGNLRQIDLTQQKLQKQIEALRTDIATLTKDLIQKQGGGQASTSSSEVVTKRVELLDKRPLTEYTTLTPDPSLALFDGILTTEESRFDFGSQFGEDRVILPTFFRNFTNGFFVELGAMDGSTFSNTRVFQKHLGWKGVLIEPSDQFEKLRVHNRCLSGGAICLNLAICNSWKVAEFRTGGHPAVGGLKETMTTHHESVFFKDPSKSQLVKVPCGPMGDVLKFAGVKRIDFFSIDVEGAEVFIVDTMDWENIPVHVVMIERSFQSEITERIDRIMLQYGFKVYGYVGKNKNGKGVNSIVWVNPKNARPQTSDNSFVF